MDGSFEPIATVFETPIWLSLGWTLMALTCFLPFGVTELTVQQFCAMAICFAMAPVYGVFVLPALWKGDFAGFTKCSRLLIYGEIGFVPTD